MNISLQDESPCRKQLEIELDAAEVGVYYEEVLREYLRAARIPGFRKGKAPRALVEKRYQKDLHKDTVDKLVPDAFQKACKQQGLVVVAVLGMEQGQVFDPAAAFRFTVTADMAPQFELPAYDNLPMEGRSTIVPEDEVDQVIHRMREQQASYDDAEGRPVQRGDMVQVDFEATLDGQPLVEVVPEAKTLDHAKGFWLLADEDGFLPGMAEGLEGAAIGETRQIPVTFGEDFIVKPLAGKSPVYAMTVKGIREKKLPAVDEEFLKKLGVETEAALREQIRAEMEAGASRNETQRLMNEAARVLLERTQLDVPQSEVEEVSEKLIRDIAQEQTAKGVKREEIEAAKDEIFSEAQGMATNQVKLQYIAEGIAAKEEIVVGRDEVSQYLSAMATRYRMTKEDVDAMLKGGDAITSIVKQLTVNKVLKALVERADITSPA